MRGGHYAPMARWTRRAAWRSGWHLAPARHLVEIGVPLLDIVSVIVLAGIPQ
jgi:hypothetical protein